MKDPRRNKMSPTFVTNETEDEDILFAAFGEIKKGQDPKKSILIKEGESLTGMVKQISDSPTYKKVFRLKVEGQDKLVLVLGKTDLLNKAGYGTAKAKRVVKEGDLIQITFDGMTKTGKGRPFFKFTVGIAK